MGEGIQEIGREFVERACAFVEGTFGFHVFQISYQALDAVSVPLPTERVRFDILLFQTRINEGHNPPREEKKYFYCECKKRQNLTELRSGLKEFLVKAVKASPQLRRDFADNFGFIFFCNKPFGVDQENLQNVEYIRQFLDNAYEVNVITQLCDKIGIIFLTDWILETTARGRQR
jgi:hypothetical protein